jgi:electron transport complex protein RnfC
MLIINGAECEPYITCDDMVMRDKPNEILGGIEIMMLALNTNKCLIGIEDNKPEAADILRRAITRLKLEDKVSVVITPTVYPTGGEKQLVTILTGKEVPSGGLPIHIGIVVHNVGTAAATYEAIVNNHPIISRLVTVTGKGVQEPGNVEVLLGTPIREIIEFCGGYTPEFEYLIAGGPMMGMALQNDEVPLVKRINCILVGAKGELAPLLESHPCIRCGSCANACPMNLLPQQMFWYLKAQNFEEAARHNLFDCIECGCCSFACPSKIPLVQSFQFGKFEIRTQQADERKSERSKVRSARKLERQEREKKAAEERKAQALAAAAAKKAAEAAAAAQSPDQPS